MIRQGSALERRADAKGTWNYASGFLAYALEQLGDAAGEPQYSRYGARIIDSYIGPGGEILGFDPHELNLDQILPGRATLALYEATRDPKYRAVAATLRRQLSLQPRTREGGFWHKRIYPGQMWLDGLYMAGPFYAHYAAVFNDPEARRDAVHQLFLADSHLYDPSTGLYYHAWDESRLLPWADPKTGHSPSFWARSIGWYAMALVDILGDLPSGDPDAPKLKGVVERVASGIRSWQDPASGVWWQVVDKGPRQGNYLESSGSSMFVYALAKAVNRGWLPSEIYAPTVNRAYTGLVSEFIHPDSGGHLSLIHCCSVAGLNNTNAAGRQRDGSFDYYVSEPIVENDLKGVAAFILAGLEVQRLSEHALSTPAQ
jgi:unsaturated rhamnogalacturonyl hydrolase